MSQVLRRDNRWTKLDPGPFFVRKVDNVHVYRKRRDININGDVPFKTNKDEGALFYAHRSSPSIVGHDGFYHFDGVNFRKIGYGEHTTITVEDDESILNHARIRQCSVLPLTSAGAVTPGTATTKPLLADGYPGQKLILINVGANTITLTTQASMAASNLLLHQVATELAAKQAIELVFTEALGDWIQTVPITA
jgi:hypothetical protein